MRCVYNSCGDVAGVSNAIVPLYHSAKPFNTLYLTADCEVGGFVILRLPHYFQFQELLLYPQILAPTKRVLLATASCRADTDYTQ